MKARQFTDEEMKRLKVKRDATKKDIACAVGFGMVTFSSQRFPDIADSTFPDSYTGLGSGESEDVGVESDNLFLRPHGSVYAAR